MSILQLRSPSLHSRQTNLIFTPKFPHKYPPERYKVIPIRAAKHSLGKSIHSNPIPHNINNSAQPRYLFPQTFQSLTIIAPFIKSHWKLILKGWLCSLISVYSLAKIVPKIGSLSANLDGFRLRDEGLVLCVLVVARCVASYWQQAFLWEAALKSAYGIRVYVFEKVLERDLAFFEGGAGVLAGDIAYRITAEASDVADTFYALLNTIVPNMLQLSAMAAQILVISPVLSLISAMVIPCMALVSAYFGEMLCNISNKSHISIASLSSYLNEI